jgi:hypothetical protein
MGETQREMEARHTLVYKQLLKKAPREAGLRSTKNLGFGSSTRVE